MSWPLKRLEPAIFWSWLGSIVSWRTGQLVGGSEEFSITDTILHHDAAPSVSVAILPRVLTSEQSIGALDDVLPDAFLAHSLSGWRALRGGSGTTWRP